MLLLSVRNTRSQLFMLNFLKHDKCQILAWIEDEELLKAKITELEGKVRI